MTKRILSAGAGCAAISMLILAALLVRPAGAEARSGPVQLGAAVYTQAFLSDPDPRYRGTLAGYDSITAETAMKIAALQPQRGRFDFAAADAMAQFAAEHGQQVFGHTLSWCADSTLPGWLRNGSWNRTSLLTVLEQHIAAVMAHFRGRVQAWDVVNEALDDDGSRRDCLWQRVIGDDWIEHAFRFARSADPTAKLFYNETRADVSNPKYEAMLAMVRDLRGRGVPVDGVGLQFHLNASAPTQAQAEDSIRRLGELSVDVHISELDVPVWYMGGTQERKFARQAEIYRSIAAACHAQPACFQITTWGFTDRYTWRLPWGSSLPLPFDSEYRPKPAWTAMQEAIHPPPPPPPPPSPTPQPAPSPPPQPSPEPAATAAAASTEKQAAATPAQADALPPFTLKAALRRQRLRTWLQRRAIPVLLEVDGTPSASVQLVARVRGRVIGRATVTLTNAQARLAAPLPLTAAARKRLRAAGVRRLVLTAVATDANGRVTKAIAGPQAG